MQERLKIFPYSNYHLFQVLWSGVITNYSTSPFAEEMFEKTKQMLTEYEVVINRWPQYTVILENVSSIFVFMETYRQMLDAVSWLCKCINN